MTAGDFDFWQQDIFGQKYRQDAYSTIVSGKYRQDAYSTIVSGKYRQDAYSTFISGKYRQDAYSTFVSWKIQAGCLFHGPQRTIAGPSLGGWWHTAGDFKAEVADHLIIFLGGLAGGR
jgi:hypothetical protein